MSILHIWLSLNPNFFLSFYQHPKFSTLSFQDPNSVQFRFPAREISGSGTRRGVRDLVANLGSMTRQYAMRGGGGDERGRGGDETGRNQAKSCTSSLYRYYRSSCMDWVRVLPPQNTNTQNKDRQVSLGLF